MTTSHKPRICIAFPGLHYVHYSPYILGTLPLLPYLSQDFEVSLAFRKNLEEPLAGYSFLTFLDSQNLSEREQNNKNIYFSPPDYLRLFKYQRLLKKFTSEHAKDFDLVIEKEWPFLGVLAQAFSEYDIPTIVVAEAVFNFPEKTTPFWKLNNPTQLLNQTLAIGYHKARPILRKRWTKNATRIVGETEQLKNYLQSQGDLLPNQPVDVIPNGIDPQVFYPQDRTVCREQLGIPQDAFVLTYVGSLNRFIQEPAYLIEALGRERNPRTVLYMVGDGVSRQELEEIAKTWNSPVVFTGRVSQAEAARYINAANLCVAPYNKGLFPDNQFTSASLKVCEYLACGRLVTTIPCDRMNHLLDGGEYGFFVENSSESYHRFIQDLPSFEELSDRESRLLSDLQNSLLKEKQIVLTWEDIAQLYKQSFEKALA
ncbi:MAG: glycosyltransferase [Desertifilum sp.]|nr:glycosyltransferase [Oscillatoria laete-virens]MCD8490028.1 glycosyltransferase [Desertifilum sp.]MDL5052259.1 glycosyltransferase [Oscillatoria laete-virens NRMC-F 0139]